MVTILIHLGDLGICSDAPMKDSTFNERFGITGYKFIQEEAYDWHKMVRSFPRFMIIEIQHQNPCHDDS